MAKSRNRKEYMKEYQKKYYAKNKEKLLNGMKKYNEDHKDQIRKRKKSKYEENSIKTTNRSTNLNLNERKIRKRSRSYARKFKKSECGICRSNESLERHHWNYKKPYKNTFNALCKTYHSIQHIKHFGGGI